MSIRTAHTTRTAAIRPPHRRRVRGIPTAGAVPSAVRVTAAHAFVTPVVRELPLGAPEPSSIAALW